MLKSNDIPQLMFSLFPSPLYLKGYWSGNEKIPFCCSLQTKDSFRTRECDFDLKSYQVKDFWLTPLNNNQLWRGREGKGRRSKNKEGVIGKLRPKTWKTKTLVSFRGNRQISASLPELKFSAFLQVIKWIPHLNICVSLLLLSSEPTFCFHGS